MSAYIPQAGPIISAVCITVLLCFSPLINELLENSLSAWGLIFQVFGVAEIIIDGHVPDEVGEQLNELSSALDSVSSLRLIIIFIRIFPLKLKKEITEGVKKVTEVCKGLNYKKVRLHCFQVTRCDWSY